MRWIWNICAVKLIYYTYQIQCLVVVHPDTYLSIEEKISKYGYPLEHHYVTTPDNYILLMHRIPYGKNKQFKTNSRIPILFNNGLLGSSENYIVTGPNKSIGYFMADNGYDVWLANGRGNVYSRNHTTLNPDFDKNYWDFSWHEIGVLDTPACIDYILNITKHEKLYIIGISQGVTSTMVTLSERPEYNDKVIASIMFGPAVFASNTVNGLFRIVSKFSKFLEMLANKLGLHEIIPNNRALNKLVTGICIQSDAMLEICVQILFIIGGYGNDHNFDRSTFPVLSMHYPSGISVRQILHYAQLIISGKFRQYDHGRSKNLAVYNRTTPPDYNLRNIKSGMVLFYGYNDWIVTLKDVEKLKRYLPNVVGYYVVPHYNHVDFIVASDVMETVNKPSLKFMKNFEKNLIKTNTK